MVRIPHIACIGCCLGALTVMSAAGQSDSGVGRKKALVAISDEPMLRHQSYEEYWRQVDDFDLNFWRSGLIYERSGERAWAPLPDAERFKRKLEEIDSRGWAISFTESIISIDQNNTPDRFRGTPLDDPKLLDAYEVYLRDFMARYGAHLDFYNIGNEVSTYFSAHPEEWPGFIGYVKRGATVLRELKPELKIGIVFTSDGGARFWPDVAPLLDYFAYTYYAPFSTSGNKSPAKDALDPASPQYFPKAMEEMLALAAGKPVMITEIGCPSSPEIDSSPEVQAQFVELLFDWLEEHDEQVLGICFLELQDWSPTEMPQKLQNVLDERIWRIPGMLEYLTSLGLLNLDGTKKPAYEVFKRAVRQYLQTP